MCDNLQKSNLLIRVVFGVTRFWLSCHKQKVSSFSTGRTRVHQHMLNNEHVPII